LSATREKVFVHGETTVVLNTEEGPMKKVTFQVASVGKILISCVKIANQGNQIIVEKAKPRIVDKNNETTRLHTKNGVYVLKAKVMKGNGKKATTRAPAKAKDDHEDRQKDGGQAKGARQPNGAVCGVQVAGWRGPRR
jgi:hypothetical protein